MFRYSLIRYVIFIAFISANGILVNGCAVLRLKAPIRGEFPDWRMFGNSDEHRFFDTSRYTFPIDQAWEFDGNAGFGYASPIISDSVLFLGTLQGEVHALNIITGKRFGHVKLRSPIPASLAVYRDRLIIATESGKKNLYGYDLSDNSIFWEQDVGGVVASPIIWKDRVIVAALNGTVACYEALYGTLIWTYDAKEEIRSTPVVSDGVVYCITMSGELVALNADDGNMVWKQRTPYTVTAGLTIYKDQIIAAARDSVVAAFDVKEGDQTFSILVNDKVVATPSIHEHRMYVPTLRGTVYAFDLTNRQEIWKFTARSAVNTTPFVTPSAIFIASLDAAIYALAPDDGSVLWKHQFEHRIKTTPLSWKGRLILLPEDKTVYCFTNSLDDSKE